MCGRTGLSSGTTRAELGICRLCDAAKELVQTTELAVGHRGVLLENGVDVLFRLFDVALILLFFTEDRK